MGKIKPSKPKKPGMAEGQRQLNSNSISAEPTDEYDFYMKYGRKEGEPVISREDFMRSHRDKMG